MNEQNLHFNILTFDFPSENLTFYFSAMDIDKSHKIHRTLFPKNIESLFSGILSNGTDFIYTTFTGEKEGFKPLDIDLNNENPDLVKRYYNRQINFYFRRIKQQIVKVGFIKENQVWVHLPKFSTSHWNTYMKFSLKVQLCTVSNYPELLISYDGTSKVLT
jgi:hypothetical protein